MAKNLKSILNNKAIDAAFKEIDAAGLVFLWIL
jgi:hypothetical protein